jgi:hypothetical protein
MKQDEHINQGVLFEENYLLRTLGGVAKKADVALTELVANAWDAGASRVDITLPQAIGDALIIEDDGTGMTSDQFHERWMKLGYNRLTHQGEQVSFPDGQKKSQRVAYGRNGIGRHGLLCFNNEYVVETGGSKYTVTTQHSESPLFVSNTEIIDSRLGTRLQVRVNRNFPHEEKIKEIIGTRFLHDPQFQIVINGDVINLEDHKGFLDKRSIKVSDDIYLEILFFDATKAARHTRQQGVAFWVSGRLVGEPSWVLGGNSVIDGRSHFAKRYTFIVKSNDLGQPGFIKEDWTGFNDVEEMAAVHELVENYVTEKYREVSSAKIKETSNEVLLSKRPEIEKLSTLSQVEIKNFIDSVTAKDPAIRAEALAVSVSAMIEIEETRDRILLIQKILQLPDEDVEGLNRLLEDWTVRDALVVLDEIDTRLKVIEAIKKLADDPNTDELHTLHPLITQARWVFGAEFDTSEYASNVSLKNAIAKVLNVKVDGAEFINPRKRPDLVCLSDFTYSVTGLEEITADGIYQFKKILIIELKRGGFEITRSEMDQAGGYVEDFIGSGYLDGDFEIKAFVVGSKINEKIQRDRTVGRGTIKAITFGQIVRTAGQRLFRLRTVLNERYDLQSGVDIFNDLKTKNEPTLDLNV